MAKPGAVQAYPWEALETIPKGLIRVLNTLDAPTDDCPAVGRALSDLLGRDVEVVFKHFCDPGPIQASNQALHFLADDDSFGAALEVEPQLVDALITCLLRQTPGVASARVLDQAGIRGFVARLCIEGARSLRPPVGLRVVDGPADALPAPAGIKATVLFDGKPYTVSCAVARVRPNPLVAEPKRLARLGRVTLRVPLVGALCRLDRSDLMVLQEHDAIVSDDWWFDKDFSGSLALAAEGSTRAAFFEIVGERSAKLSGVRELPLAEEDLMADPDSDSAPTEVADSIAEAVLEAPVVVRIEVATVSMSAADFAELRPGSVIETDQRIGQLATLRVAGREIAQGELVTIDGELGVRIRKLTRGN